MPRNWKNAHTETKNETSGPAQATTWTNRCGAWRPGREVARATTAISAKPRSGAAGMSHRRPESTLVPHRVQLVDVDGPVQTEQAHEDRQPDRRFRCRDRGDQ